MGARGERRQLHVRTWKVCGRAGGQVKGKEAAQESEGRAQGNVDIPARTPSVPDTSMTRQERVRGFRRRQRTDAR